MLLEGLSWLEASALGQAVRGAGVWSYATINLAHMLGVATLFGSVLLLDLKLLGLIRGIPLSLLSAPTVRVAAVGFCIATLSGLCLLATNATEYSGNPFLLIKFGAIAVGLANALFVHRMRAWRDRSRDSFTVLQNRQLSLTGGISLLAWATAMAAGRMLGYW